MLKKRKKEKEIFIMNCPKCGTEIPAGASFCTGCGFRLENPAPDASKANTESKSEPNFPPEEAAENPEIISSSENSKPDPLSADNAEFSVIGSEPLSDEPAASGKTPEKTSETPVNPFETPKYGEPSVNNFENASPETETAPYFSADSTEAKTKDGKIKPEFPTKPLSAWSYIWRELIFLIPIVNIIALFIFAFAEGINKNSRSFARSRLIFALIITLMFIAGVILFYIYSDEVILWLRGALEWLTMLGA